MTWLTRKVVGYALAGAVALAFVWGVWWFATEPGRQKEKAAEAQVGQVVAEGKGKISQDAAEIAIGGKERDAAIDRETQRAVDELIATPEDRRDASAVAALCLRDAYRSTPSCVQLRKLHP